MSRNRLQPAGVPAGVGLADGTRWPASLDAAGRTEPRWPSSEAGAVVVPV